MEKLGLLTRQTDTRDARLAFVVLTKAGLKKVREARATFAKQASYVFRDRSTNEELEQLCNSNLATVVLRPIAEVHLTPRFGN